MEAKKEQVSSDQAGNKAQQSPTAAQKSLANQKIYFTTIDHNSSQGD